MPIDQSLPPSEIQARSRRDSFDLDFSNIHRSIVPQDVRPTDRILARVRRRDGVSTFESARVWRLSPLGVEILFPESECLPKGVSVDLELVVAGQRSMFEGLVVDVLHGVGKDFIAGIRLARKTPAGPAGGNRRTGERWLCSDEFLPTCVAPTPGRFDDFIYFQIRDISAEGLQLTCSLRNKFLIPGMRLGLTAVFPMAQMAQIEVEIVRVGITSLGGRDRLVLGTRFCGLTEFARAVLGQYVLQFSNVDSLDELRTASLVPRKVSLGVDFYNLKSEADYKDMLELRYLAHARDGNLKVGAHASDLADINDARSRIVIGKYKGRVVATARVRFNELDEPMEHEAYVAWPKHLPRRDQIIEVSRVATHPNFRRNDLLAALFRYTYMSVVQRDRPWVIMSCLDHMIPFYSKLGFSNTGIRHTEPHWRDDRVLNIMIANVFDLILGRGVSPAYWNLVWKDLAKHYRSNGSG
jgi:predicted GNAT family N-acyltransferase